MNWSEQSLLVISPHPDDEVIGCGGLLAKVAQAGGQTFVHHLTVANTDDFSSAGSSSYEERIQEIKEVSEYVGINDWCISLAGDEHHLRLDQIDQAKLISTIENDAPLAINTIKPTMIAMPNPSGYNQDHRAATQATMSALRPSGGSFRHHPQTVLIYEQPADRWNHDQRGEPNFFVELGVTELDTKLRSIEMYASQDRPVPNPRSRPVIKANAELRGAQCGVEHAEAYWLVRHVN